MADRTTYPPSPEFVQRANISGPEAYRQLRERAAANPEAFWGELAEKELFWFEKWSKTLDWKVPFAKCSLVGK
jgi:acetyl-CoA synthetase